MVHRKTIETIRRYYGGVDLRSVDMKAIGQIVRLKTQNCSENNFNQSQLDSFGLHDLRNLYTNGLLLPTWFYKLGPTLLIKWRNIFNSQECPFGKVLKCWENTCLYCIQNIRSEKLMDQFHSQLITCTM